MKTFFFPIFLRACTPKGPGRPCDPQVQSAKRHLHTWLITKQTYFPWFFFRRPQRLHRDGAGARARAEHTSLYVSTYKRLSFILLKCYLINVLVTLNISTAGGTFVIVEMAGRVGHRWELLPHAGVDVWAAGRGRRAHEINNAAPGLEPERGWAPTWDLTNYNQFSTKKKCF